MNARCLGAAARTALLGAALTLPLARPGASAAPAQQPAAPGVPAAAPNRLPPPGLPGAATAPGARSAAVAGPANGTAAAALPPPAWAPNSAAAAADDDIRDIRGPRPIVSPWLIWMLVAAGIFAAALAYLVWRAIKRRRRVPVVPDFEVALGRLLAARALMQPGGGREFSIEVSGIVREYIESRFSLMAAHRTTHEFLHDLLVCADSGLANYRDLLGEFLQSCDLAKFGGWHLTAEQMDTMLESARRFVQSASTLAAGAPQPAAAAQAVPRSHSDSSRPRVSLPST